MTFPEVTWTIVNRMFVDWWLFINRINIIKIKICLGLVLLRVEINDLLVIFEKFESWRFTDGTIILFINKAKQNLAIGFDKFHVLSSWLNLNKLSLNVQKTWFITFISCCFDVNVDGKKLKQDTVVKYLGIEPYKCLNFKSYIWKSKTKSVHFLGYFVSWEKLCISKYSMLFYFNSQNDIISH